MKSWWNWLAKDVKRHPKAVTKPPKTAVKRVDFLLQIPMVMGDISNERHDEVAPSHPVTQKNISYNLNFGSNYNEPYHYIHGYVGYTSTYIMTLYWIQVPRL